MTLRTANDGSDGLLWQCSRCPARRMLMGVVKGQHVCPACLLALGLQTDPLADVHELEIQTRERMTARGGTDRHLVRKGLT